MRKNMGPIDRIIRLIIVFALLAISLFAPLTAGWTALLFIVAAFELVSVAAAY